MAAHIHHRSLTKWGEDVCGDSVRHSAGDDSVFAVLSDGLGSGIKAHILSSLTVRIIETMAAADLPLDEIVRTITHSLPICRERHIAYSTFAVVQVHRDATTELIVYDSPPPIVVHGGDLVRPEYGEREIAGRAVRTARLPLGWGDAVLLVSDGVLHAGLGGRLNFGWGWDNVAAFVCDRLREHGSARQAADELLAEVLALYGGRPGDDATVVVAEIRRIRRVVVLSGPPVDPDEDAAVVGRFLRAPGDKVVCGGTTANIVSRLTGWAGEVDLDTARPDCPPMGRLDGIDLVTEGVLTMAKTVALIRQTAGDAAALPDDRNGAVALARTLLEADHVELIVGLKVDPFYQNPLLPLSVSLRKYLVEELVRQLESAGKSVEVEYH